VSQLPNGTNANPEMNSLKNTGFRCHGVFRSPDKLYPSLALIKQDFEPTKGAVDAAVSALNEGL